MHKRILAALLTASLVNLVCHAQSTTGPTPKEIEEANEVVNTVFKVGLRSGVLMRVRFKNGSELKGYITDADEEGFVILPAESQSTTRVKYQQVKQVKKFQGRGRKIGSVVGYVAMFGVIVAMGIGYARK